MGHGTGEAGRSIWEKHEFEGKTILGLSLRFTPGPLWDPELVPLHNPPIQRCDEDSVK